MFNDGDLKFGADIGYVNYSDFILPLYRSVLGLRCAEELNAIFDGFELYVYGELFVLK